MKLKSILSECWTGYVQRGMKNKGGRQVPNCVPESVSEANASDVIKDLDKVKNDLLKKVDVLVAKKKKLYSNVDIESPMSADEKKLDKDIADLFSQINQLVLQKRSLKSESTKKEKVYIDYLNKDKGFKQDRKKFNSYEDAVKWAKKNFEKFSPDMIKYESVNEDTSKKDIEKLTSYKDLSKFIKANKSKINSKDFNYIEDEVEALKYLESDYKRGKADRQEVEVAVIDAQDSIKRAMGIKESVNEGRSVKSVQKDLDKVLDNIQSALAQYKSHKGTDSEKKHIENLKKLNDLKKKLESELDSAVSGLYRDVELKIED